MLGKARRMAGEFQGHVDEMVREAKLDEVKREIDQFRSNVQNEVYKATQVDDLKRDIVDPLKDTMRDLERPFDQPASASPAEPTAPVAPVAPVAAEPLPAAPVPEPALATPAAPAPEEPPAFVPPGTSRA
jgi:sec-independent protein translocase protein TatB